MVTNAQILCVDMWRHHWIGTALVGNVFQEFVPVVETEELRQDFKGAVSCFVGPVDVAPKTFQGGGTHGLPSALPDGAAEEDEVVWCLHLTLQLVFNAFFKFRDFWAGLLHGLCICFGKVTVFFDNWEWSLLVLFACLDIKTLFLQKK